MGTRKGLKGGNKLISKDMIENIIIVILLCVIVVLLVNFYSDIIPLDNLFKKSEEVVSEEMESFEGNNMKVVLFYAPWCPHCTSFMPEWDSLGESISAGDTNVLVEKIDCDQNPEAARDYQIQGFPTVKLVNGPNGTQEYGGARNANDVRTWVNSVVSQ